MTASATTDSETRKVALLVACASILQVVESLLPQPFPGVRLGLANAVAVVALADLGVRAAMEVAVLRTVISSLILGTFLSPTFLLSFGAAMTSTAAMALVHAAVGRARRPLLSLVGVCLVGATVHNLAQISLVYLLLVRHAGIFLLWPWLGISAVVVGWITGLVASRAFARLQVEAGRDASSGRPEAVTAATGVLRTPWRGVSNAEAQAPGVDSWLRRLPAAVKIAAVCVLAIVILFLRSGAAFAAVLLVLCLLAVLGRVFGARWLAPLLKLRFFLLFSFLVPLLLTRTGAVWLQWKALVITDEGAMAGALVVWRVVLLTLGTSLLVRTTPPSELARGLGVLLTPWRGRASGPGRTAAILTQAWGALPALWDVANGIVRPANGARRPWRSIIPILGDTLAAMYHASGRVRNCT